MNLSWLGIKDNIHLQEYDSILSNDSVKWTACSSDNRLKQPKSIKFMKYKETHKIGSPYMQNQTENT